jgi:hypothetical protein
MENTVLEIDRGDHGNTRLFAAAVVPLEPGQVRLRIDRFALTANNITYAVAGDMFGYWDFFPAEGNWGRVPAMGWADVVESNHPDIAEGGRYYGWFPMAQYVTFTAGKTADGFRDDGEHRSEHAPVYRSYVHTEHDPWYAEGEDNEDRHALLRGLFLTGFLAEEFFADENYYGAEQVLVLSASSKTAIGFSQRAAARGTASVIGLTSTGNVEFVNSLGLYDSVVSYDDLESINKSTAVAIDMSGAAGVVARVHEHLGDDLQYSMAVGMSHHDAPPTEVTAGPPRQMFFAPTEVSRRSKEWGREDYAKRTTEALHSFVEHSSEWMALERTEGPELAADTWHAVRDGAVAPSTGRIVSLHSADRPAGSSKRRGR